MPRVLELKDGRRYFWYSNEHDPAHVHVASGGCEAKFALNCPAGSPRLVQRYQPRMPDIECRAIEKALVPHVHALCKKWSNRP